MAWLATTGHFNTPNLSLSDPTQSYKSGLGVFKGGLGVLRVVWGVSMDRKYSCYSPVPKLLNCTKWPRELKIEKYFNDIFKPDRKCFSQACSKID